MNGRNNAAAQILAEAAEYGQCIYRLFNGLIQVDVSYAGAVMTAHEFALFTELLVQSPRPANDWRAGQIVAGGPRRFVVYCRFHQLFTIGFGHALLRVPLERYESLVVTCQHACAALEAEYARWSPNIPPPQSDAFGFSPN